MSTPHSSSFPNWHHELLQSFRLPFWFACFLAVIGTAWRQPLINAGLIVFFLVLLAIVEWAAHRLTATRESVTLTEETVQQQMIRSRTADGRDRFDGTFWAEFPPETLTTTVHIPFCPAFDRVPNVQVFPMDETDVHLRTASPKTFGVRIDVKRNNTETDRFRFALIAEG